MDVRPDWKPVSEGGIGRKKPDKGRRRRGRVTASRDGWIKLRAEKVDGERCRLCDDTFRLSEHGLVPPRQCEAHHVVARSLGGDDVADNIVPLCAGHHFRVTNRDPDSLRLLAERLTDAEYAYVIGKIGENALHRLFGVYRRGEAAS